MNEFSASLDDTVFQRRAIEAAIRIGLVILLVVWCFNIVKPFVLLVLWGAIIAVAVYPLFAKLQSVLGGRKKLAATLMVLIALAMLITPTIMLSESVIENSESLAKRMQEGTFTIPPPAEKVRSWPLVGEKLYDTWSLASTNLGGALNAFGPHLTALANKAVKKSLSAAARVGVVVLQFILSVIIAGALLVYAESSGRVVERVTARLMGEQGGKNMAYMAGATIRSVAQGVLGVAVIQAVLAGIGLFVMGVPYAGIWTLLVLVLAIVQLPTIFVLGPIMVYVFSVASTVPAVIFVIWTLLVGLSDSFLKPLLLGRGLDIPMPVILLGAIGGMLLSGIIGLFVGAVVLAVGHTLFMLWLNEGMERTPEAGGAT
jgi:predicted PurR-regulated permease PerM